MVLFILRTISCKPSCPVLQLVLTAAILFQAFVSSRASKQNATFGVLRQLAAGQEAATTVLKIQGSVEQRSISRWLLWDLFPGKRTRDINHVRQARVFICKINTQ
jgi:hypothetical protein